MEEIHVEARYAHVHITCERAEMWIPTDKIVRRNDAAALDLTSANPVEENYVEIKHWVPILKFAHGRLVIRNSTSSRRMLILEFDDLGPNVAIPVPLEQNVVELANGILAASLAPPTEC